MSESFKPEPAKAKTTQEKLNDVNLKLAQLAQETGYLQYNISTYQDDLVNKNIQIKNTILDMNKLNEQLQKEKSEEKPDEDKPTHSMVPPTTEEATGANNATVH